ncbi:hypothetical protein SAZ10_15465 [Mesorhizobium sp. BAC0120]|uniref:hypothetical protein n=1 Tax=Mesorhizobium sp. BAC0120 TaxID=3090670 RepID=UPI00298D3658|nr:hypothetical protein [Mesorhizobium sp. BAC0120]MDW6023157.1 hypothetical protein [Mesorhizobium sp. BAC0120]
MPHAVSERGVIGAAAPEESSRSAISWGAVIAGGVAAAAATLVLMLVGSGLGLTMVSPFSNQSASLTTLTVSTAIWLIIVQWASAALGGYLAARLRAKWVNVHTDEVFFRDTAHGFLAWALATLLVAGLLGSTITSMLGTGVQAASNVAAGAAMGGASAAANGNGNQTSYFVDALLRPADPTKPVEGGGQAAAEVSRILVASAASGQMQADDRAYLDRLVAARAGLSPADAKARVDAVLQRVNAAAQQAKEAAETARKAGATFALVGALSLVIGAFIASVSAALGGRLRDENEGALMAS